MVVQYDSIYNCGYPTDTLFKDARAEKPIKLFKDTNLRDLTMSKNMKTYNIVRDVRAFTQRLIPPDVFAELKFLGKIEFENFKYQYIDGRRLKISRDAKKARYISFFSASRFVDVNEFTTDLEVLNGMMKKREQINKLGLNDSNIMTVPQICRRWYRRTNIPPSNIGPVDVRRTCFNDIHSIRMEAQQRGTFDELYRWDMNGAYINSLAHIPDFTEGLWERATSRQLKKLMEEDINHYQRGIVNADIKTDSVMNIQPMPKVVTDISGDRYAFPRFKECYCPTTLNMIKYLHQSGSADVVPRDGWIWNTEHLEYPYRPFCMFMYEKRKELSNSKLLKGSMNSFHGSLRLVSTRMKEDPEGPIRWKNKYFSEVSTAGDMFEPISYSMSVTDVQIRLHDIIQQLKADEITAQTIVDSFIVTEKVDMARHVGKKMGEWHLECKGDGLIISPNVWSMNDDLTGEVVTKSMGIPLPPKVPLWELFSEHGLTGWVKVTGKDGKEYQINTYAPAHRVWHKKYFGNQLLHHNESSIPMDSSQI